MNPTQERRIWDLLEGKLEETARRTSYFEEPVESEAYRRFDSAWVEYLGVLGVSRVDWDFGFSQSKYYLVKDPLYTSGKWLRMSRDVADRILAIGLP